jgi:cysteine desulfurase
MKIYLDYAATTPVEQAVLRAMKPYFSEKFGNAGSLHSFGQAAIAAVDRSRETLAGLIRAEFREIIFTGSATEANNLAIRGVVRQAPKGRGEGAGKPRIIVSSIEHESVLETARDLEKDGVEVLYLPVDKFGVVDLQKLKESLTEQTALVSVMYVNNEIGTVQPIVQIAKIIRDFRNHSPLAAGRGPLFHCDASQAFNYYDCAVHELGVDLMTLSSHKMYGPKGAAALYVRVENVSRLLPIMTGGGQEFGLRSGTENVPAIVGFAKAAEVAATMREKEAKRTAELRDHFWRGIKKIYPSAEINGTLDFHPQFSTSSSSPHILNVYFPSHEAQDILTRLDLAGIAASSGSACRSRALESSYVTLALGHAKARARSSVRFSFGRSTTKIELAHASKVLKKILR